MGNAVGDMALRRLSQRRLKFVGGSISSYCYILNSPECLEHKMQSKTLAYVMCALGSDHVREKEEKKKRENRSR